MKKLILKKSKFEGAEVLSKAQLKKIMGGDDGGSGSGSGESRCKSDTHCYFYGSPDNTLMGGGCYTMETGQCRCVSFANGSATQSVPHDGCLA